MPGLAHHMSAAATLPNDARATLVGRIWSPAHGGPCVVRISGGEAEDITETFPTMRDLCEMDNPAAAARAARADPVAPLVEILANTPTQSRNHSKPWLLPPVDLQAVKAAGVTFAISMLERVIEERARGSPAAAEEIRRSIRDLIGDDLAKLKPGSPEAMNLKQVLIAKGVWSQYLEVGIGPDAEIFTKAQPMSAVGHGMDAGLNPISTWNNPEPEVVIVVASTGRIVGATLGNDVNLRDVEGRSALLLSKAKDNNASCAIGPFIRLFDDHFSLDHVRNMQLSLKVEGPEGYVLEGGSTMSRISRDPADLAAQMLNRNHQYPDGAVLFLGTLFAPIADRDVKGQGFTHKLGDIVTVSSPELGALTNVMQRSDVAAPWTYGTSHLMRYLAGRGLL
jgi:fumarylacetoacetate (FAA) hydrolase family protein